MLIPLNKIPNGRVMQIYTVHHWTAPIEQLQRYRLFSTMYGRLTATDDGGCDYMICDSLIAIFALSSLLYPDSCQTVPSEGLWIYVSSACSSAPAPPLPTSSSAPLPLFFASSDSTLCLFCGATLQEACRLSRPRWTRTLCLNKYQTYNVGKNVRICFKK